MTRKLSDAGVARVYDGLSRRPRNPAPFWISCELLADGEGVVAAVQEHVGYAPLARRLVEAMRETETDAAGFLLRPVARATWGWAFEPAERPEESP